MRVIRASEIGEYLYCHRAWWLHHIQGFASANTQALAGGTEAHAGHGRLVGAASALRALAVLLLLAAILVFVASVAWR